MSVEFFETYEVSETNEKTDTIISKKVFIQLTNSFIPNVNTWENIICSLSQQEFIFKKTSDTKVEDNNSNLTQIFIP